MNILQKQITFKNWILDNINFDGYDDTHKKYRLIGRGLTNVKNSKIQIGLGIFYSEYIQHNNEKEPIQGLFKDYLQGLPSWLNIPFYYYDIRNLMYSLGYEVDQLEDDELSNLYYNEITNQFI